MKSCCIITDSSAQFLQQKNNCAEFLRIVPISIEMEGIEYIPTSDNLLTKFPAITSNNTSIRLIPPSVSQISTIFQTASEQFDEIIGVFLSTDLFPLTTTAIEAAKTSPARNRIHVIDSLTVANGLGYLVQSALEMAKNHISPMNIEEKIRNLIPRIYTVISTLSTSYLHSSDILDLPQAIALEMTNLYPIFNFEEGQLMPSQKVKTVGGIGNFLQEFLLEFDAVDSVSLVHGDVNFSIEARAIKDTCRENHPNVGYVDLSSNPTNISLFGKRNLIFSVVEK